MRFGPSGALRAAAYTAIVAGMLAIAAPANAENVVTYHYDNRRTGWNSQETVLTPGRIRNGYSGKKFHRLHSVVLDEQSDAQPLIETNQPVKGQGTHDVVYVATENNTLYAFDANTGALLRKRHFGAAVPLSSLPGGCDNNSAYIGIGSTPVVDQKSRTMYLIADIFDSGSNTPTYWLHAIDLSSLDDVMPAVKVHASGLLTNGHAYKFSAQESRQRAGLLLANGNVYAGFASYCDADANVSRGWVLGWNADTLKPLAANELTDKWASSTDDFFLSSIWMSGFGIASSPATGDIYFVTGNSDYSGDSISKVNNIAESVVQMTPELGKVKSVFTPDNAVSLENGDVDFGSGGVTLLPPQAGSIPNLAVAAGKDSTLYLLNADNLHNHTSGSARILDTTDIGGCWCGETYYTASDGTPRIIGSGGSSATILKINTGSHPTFQQLGSTDDIGGVQDGGFFTVVSSNGQKAHTAVIWAVSRPDGSSKHHVYLYAFNADSGGTVYSSSAGTWPNLDGNSNIVPVAANAKVYVASYKQLEIFGFGNGVSAAELAPQVAAESRAPLASGQHEFYGTVRGMSGSTITVARRDGTIVTVDARPAIEKMQFAEPRVGKGILVRGYYRGANAMAADNIFHAKPNPLSWRPDR